MTATELLSLPPAPPGADRWLFDERLVERRNSNTFHSPAHSGAVMAVSALLGGWCRRQSPRVFRAYGYGCPYRLTANPDTVVTFDVSVVKPTAPIDRNAPWIESPPALAVEVVEAGEDLQLIDYLVDASITAGVEVVWVIDPFEEYVVSHRRGVRPVRIDIGALLTAEPVLPGFRCKVSEIFE